MLEKAQIRPETPAGARPITVLFNPNQYTFTAQANTQPTPVPGQGAPVLQYTGGTSRTLGMTLFFDTYEHGTDVRDHTDRIYELLEVEATTHRPPVLNFAWGGFTFRCILESVTGSFVLFLDDGTPVRATLQVSFKEYVDPKDAPKQTVTQSADHTKTYVVRRGDSIASIAAAEYEDATAWRPIAAANAIANPRVLEPGRRIVIPPLPTRKAPR